MHIVLRQGHIKGPEDNERRHPGKSPGPVSKTYVEGSLESWIPAFAGMTGFLKLIFVGKPVILRMDRIIMGWKPMPRWVRLARAFVFSLFLGVVFFGKAQAKTLDVQTSVARGSQLRIREIPSLEGSVLGFLSKGEEVLVVARSTFSTEVGDGAYPWFQVVNTTGTRGWVSARYMEPAKTLDMLDLKPKLFDRCRFEVVRSFGWRSEAINISDSFNIADLDGDGKSDISFVVQIHFEGTPEAFHEDSCDETKEFFIINGGVASTVVDNPYDNVTAVLSSQPEFRDVVGDVRKEMIAIGWNRGEDGGDCFLIIWGSLTLTEPFHQLASLNVGYGSAGGQYNPSCQIGKTDWTKSENNPNSSLSFVSHLSVNESGYWDQEVADRPWRSKMSNYSYKDFPNLIEISRKDTYDWTESGLVQTKCTFIDGSLTVRVSTAPLYSDPTKTGNKILQLLSQDQKLIIREVHADRETGEYWLKVVADSQEGWVLDSQVFPSDVLEYKIRDDIFEAFKL